MELEHFLVQYGLIALLLLSMVDADLVMILAGVVAHLGFFDLRSAMLVGAAGNLLGDGAWYGLGRWHATWLKSTGVYRRVGPTVEQLARRLGAWQLFAARAIYGTRVVSMVFWGLHGLDVVRFLLFDGLACLLWATALAGLGYFLSDRAASLLGRVHRVELWLLVAVLVAALLVFLITRAARRGLHAAPPNE
jgi:membrane protein DedA with SNARE-associated domain